jgi:hypothetical protein
MRPVPVRRADGRRAATAGRYFPGRVVARGAEGGGRRCPPDQASGGKAFPPGGALECSALNVLYPPYTRIKEPYLCALQ